MVKTLFLFYFSVFKIKDTFLYKNISIVCEVQVSTNCHQKKETENRNLNTKHEIYFATLR
jgi:hypothetical protein